MSIPDLSTELSIKQLIKRWKKNEEKWGYEVTPNFIFNLAVNDKLTLYAKKISWPYHIWAFEREDTHFNIETELSHVENGKVTVFNYKISFFEEFQPDDYRCNPFFDEDLFECDWKKLRENGWNAICKISLLSPDEPDDGANIFQIKKRVTPYTKKKDIDWLNKQGGCCSIERYKRRSIFPNSISNDGFLNFHIEDLDLNDLNKHLVSSVRFKRKPLKPPFEKSTLKELGNFDAGSKDFIQGYYKGLQELQIFIPGTQVQLDYESSIKKSAIYIKQEDVQQTERFLDELARKFVNPQEHIEPNAHQTVGQNKYFKKREHISFPELIEEWGKKYKGELKREEIEQLHRDGMLDLYVEKAEWPFKLWAGVNRFDFESQDFRSIDGSDLHYFLIIEGKYILEKFRLKNEDLNRLDADSYIPSYDAYGDELSYVSTHFKEPVYEKISYDELKYRNDAYCDAKEAIAGDFNDVVCEELDELRGKDHREYMALSRAEIMEHHQKCAESGHWVPIIPWPEKYKNVELYSPIEEPSQQIELVNVIEIPDSKIYVLKSDKEQAERFIKEALKIDINTHNSPNCSYDFKGNMLIETDIKLKITTSEMASKVDELINKNKYTKVSEACRAVVKSYFPNLESTDSRAFEKKSQSVRSTYNSKFKG